MKDACYTMISSQQATSAAQTERYFKLLPMNGKSDSQVGAVMLNNQCNARHAGEGICCSLTIQAASRIGGLKAAGLAIIHAPA